MYSTIRSIHLTDTKYIYILLTIFVYCHYVILFNVLYIVIMSFCSMFCILSLCHSVQCSVYCHCVILFNVLHIVIMSYCSMFCILLLCHSVQCSVYCHYVILLNVLYIVILVCLVFFMVLTATFNNISAISWWSVVLVKKTGGPGENHRPVASH
jgi:hypothetical protein